MNERVEGGIEQRGPAKRQLDVGAAVEVRNRFVGKWCHGFEVADHVDGGYVIRRVSDGLYCLGDHSSRGPIRPSQLTVDRSTARRELGRRSGRDPERERAPGRRAHGHRGYAEPLHKAAPLLGGRGAAGTRVTVTLT